MDELARAYSTLTALRQNVPDKYEVDQSWVDDFHSVLDKIEKATSSNLAEFRVSQSELRRHKSGSNYLTGEVQYDGRTVVERARFLTKVDAVLAYFQYQTAKETKGSIGFSRP